MTSTVKVFPTKASALNVRHPISGAAKIEGADWPYDVFTCSRLSDGSFTDDPKKAFKAASDSARPSAATPSPRLSSTDN
jgi:hypothetical protein